MSRKPRKNIWIVLSIVLVLSMILAACAPAATEAPPPEEVKTETPAEEPVGEKPFEGVTLNVFMETVPDTNYVKEFVPAFEEATGMDVVIEELTYSVMHEKLIPTLSAGEGAGEYDVVVVDKQWVGEFVCADWLLPLDDYIAADGFDTSVYTPAMFDMMGQVNGVTYMLPFYNYTSGLVYRKDLFEDPELQAEFEAQYGRPLKVPTTVDEYVEVAKFMTRDTDGDGEIDVYGVGAQLERYSTYWEYSQLLFAMDGWYYDDDWNAIINNETGVKALETLVDLYHNAITEAATAYSFEELMAQGAQGKAAMMLTYSWMPSLLNDPDTSAVPGMWQLTIAPGGHGAQGGWGWAIPRSAPNPDAAWAFLSYIESADVAKGRAMLGGQPVREDVFTDPEVLAKWPEVGTAHQMVAGAKPVPIICNSAQVPDAIALGVSEVLAGNKEIQEALDEVAETLNKIVIGDPLTGK